MVQVGTITVDGRQIGVITQGDGEVDASLPLLGGGDTPMAMPHDHADIGAAYGGRHHYSTRDSTPHHGEHHHHGGSQGPSGKGSGEVGDVPYSSTGNPFDRSRFTKELEQKPWLRDKMAHISLGENQDPRANLAVIETMMNRAVVRGTSLEAQVRRHRSSGKDEGGYYAGYAHSYSADKGQMFERNLGEALGQSGKGQSNVSGYATDNSSGDLARREAASGAFRHHTTINGESFFSPGHAEPAFRDRWQHLNKSASEFEGKAAHPDPVATEGLANPPVGPQSSLDSSYKVATAVQDPKYTNEDINELIGERAINKNTNTDTSKPGLNELDKTYDSPQQERFNRPYAYPPESDRNRAAEPPTDKDKKEPLPSRFYPPTPGDESDPDKPGTRPGWNIPSDYDQG